MQEYPVRWEIEVWADSPVAAARKALEIQRNPASTAVVFTIGDEKIDLQDDCSATS